MRLFFQNVVSLNRASAVRPVRTVVFLRDVAYHQESLRIFESSDLRRKPSARAVRQV